VGTAVAQDDLSNACTHSPQRPDIYHNSTTPLWKDYVWVSKEVTENTLMNSFNEEISIADMTVVEPCGTV
jgi:hypothetical protein